MIERHAVVIAQAPGRVTVEAERETGCGGCAASSGCGTALFGEVLGRRPVRLELASGRRHAPGERVRVGVSETALLSGALWLYGLPLALLLSGAVLADALARVAGLGGEGYALAGGLAGLWCGLRVARRRLAAVDAASAGARLLEDADG